MGRLALSWDSERDGGCASMLLNTILYVAINTSAMGL